MFIVEKAIEFNQSNEQGTRGFPSKTKQCAVALKQVRLLSQIVKALCPFHFNGADTGINLFTRPLISGLKACLYLAKISRIYISFPNKNGES